LLTVISMGPAATAASTGIMLPPYFNELLL